MNVISMTFFADEEAHEGRKGLFERDDEEKRAQG